MDSVINKKGKDLTELFENEGLMVINGRAPSDTPATCTYIGPRGTSIIDYIWVDNKALHIIEDFKVIEDIFTSDHLACSLSITNICQSQPKKKIGTANRTRKITKWKEDQAEKYTTELENAFSRTAATQDLQELYTKFTHTIEMISEKTGMTKTIKYANNAQPKLISKPWFNDRCSQLKKTARTSLRLCRKHNFEKEYLDKYLETKKNYKQAISEEKIRHQLTIQNDLKNTKDQQNFWKTVKKLNPKLYHKNPIEADIWQNHFKAWYEPRIQSNNSFFDAKHPYLDEEINITEIKLALQHLKPNKSPGPDNIINEQLKHLPLNGIEQLKTILNHFFEQEKIPPNLLKIK